MHYQIKVFKDKKDCGYAYVVFHHTIIHDFVLSSNPLRATDITKWEPKMIQRYLRKFPHHEAVTLNITIEEELHHENHKESLEV